MATRIYKTEKFIPKIGNPVFQVHEEMEAGSQILRLDPRNPTSEEMADADEAFAAAQQAVIASLESEKATLESEKASLIAEKASLENQLASKTEQADQLAADKLVLQSEVAQLNSSISELTSESNALASSVSDLTEKLDTSTDGNDTLSAELAVARARITSLLEEIPFDPRVIDATAFYDRLTKDEIWSLSTSEDEVTKSILAKIHEYKKPENDWPIVFESTEFMQMMGYLLQSGFITEGRMMDLTRDATKAEAYKADKA